MNRIRLHEKRRSAFTLIELLVVIAIIAILAGLLLAGVMAVLRTGPEVYNRNDITQLNIALQKFKGSYSTYPPNRIRLRANIAAYTAAEAQSVAWIGRLWPRLTGATNIRWNGAAGAATDFWDLEGDQCLVFFLSGPPGLGGFSKNPLDPVDLLNPSATREKFFDFAGNRLFNRGGNPFPSYADSFGLAMPIVYFSSASMGMGSNRYDAVPNSLNVQPYFSAAGPPVKFYNPDTCQIITAGPDGLFGPGGLWNNSTAGSMPLQGRDDYSNFSDKVLGAP